MLYIYKYIYIIQEINVKTKIISPLGTDKKRDADNIKKKQKKKKKKKKKNTKKKQQKKNKQTKKQKTKQQKKNKQKKQVHQNKINLVAKSH